MTDGYIDTSVFLHAQAHDQHTEACQALLRAAAEGRVSVSLDPLVVHELTYVLPRYVKGMPRSDVALYVRSVLSWSGVVLEDLPLWLSVLEAWEADAHLSWTDAVLIQRALLADRPIWTRNHRDFRRYLGSGLDWPPLK